jgi:DNA replication protein DnaC
MTQPRLRSRAMTEQAAQAAVDQACRALRLPTIRTRVEEIMAAAAREQLSYWGFLAELLLAECDDRDRRRSVRRVKAAGFPREKWLADFDFEANPDINPAIIHTLARGDWIRKGEPLCLIGDSGTGKTHLLIALGIAAAQQGFRVRYTLATKLVNELVEAADERQLARTITRYGRVDLLCIDELGYMELDRRGAELLFQVLTEREETASVAIASNESFSGWTKTFTDPRLCAAIVDRLTFAGNIIETGTNSLSPSPCPSRPRIDLTTGPGDRHHPTRPRQAVAHRFTYSRPSSDPRGARCNHRVPVASPIRHP